MGTIACHKAQRSSPSPESEPGAFGVFGLLIAYLAVLTVGIIADISVEKFEIGDGHCGRCRICSPLCRLLAPQPEWDGG